MKAIKLIGITVALSLATSQANADWRTQKWVDEFTDAENQTALVSNKDSEIMSVSCIGGEKATLYVDVFYRSYLSSDITRVPTKYRIDKNTPVEFDWKGKGKLTYITHEYATKFVQELLEGTDRIVIQPLNYNYDQGISKFSLVGAKEHIQPVLKKCGIEYE